MSKSPGAFRTISEVAEQLDVPAHVLRFWETRFAQVKPVKRGGGRRYYRPDDVRLLRGIRGLLYDDGMTIKGVQKILREQGVRHVITLGTPVDGADTAALATLGTEPEPRPAASVAPAPETAPAAAGAPHGVCAEAGIDGHSQADLFAGAAVTSDQAMAARLAPRHREALLRFFGDLEALRVVMVGGLRR